MRKITLHNGTMLASNASNHARGARAAQRGHGVSRTASCQLKSRMQGDPGARHTDRVADRDGPAVDVHPLRIDSEFLRRRQRDGRERLVDLDDVELVYGDALA